MLILGNVSGTVDSTSRKKRNRSNRGCDVVVCERRSSCTVRYTLPDYVPEAARKQCDRTTQFTRRNTIHGKKQSNVSLCSNGSQATEMRATGLCCRCNVYIHLLTTTRYIITGLCPRGTKIVLPDKPSFTPTPWVDRQACFGCLFHRRYSR
jgi:hypothetical protein